MIEEITALQPQAKARPETIEVPRYCPHCKTVMQFAPYFEAGSTLQVIHLMTECGGCGYEWAMTVQIVLRRTTSRFSK